MRVLAISLITLLFLSIFLSVIDVLSFGNGLGDMSLIILFSVLSIIPFLIFILSKNKTKEKYISISVISAFILILFYYKATVGRGSEYPWNGQLFKKTKNKEKDNEDRTKTKRIKRDSNGNIVN